MSQATVFSTAQFGLGDDSSATGLYVGSVTYTGTADLAEAPDHIGCVVGLGVYNMRKDVSVDGIIKAKGTGLVASVGAVLTLANTTTSTRTRLGEALGATADAGAAIVVTGSTISPTQNGFEGGGLTGVYHAFVATGSPYTLT